MTETELKTLKDFEPGQDYTANFEFINGQKYLIKELKQAAIEWVKYYKGLNLAKRADNISLYPELVNRYGATSPILDSPLYMDKIEIIKKIFDIIEADLK